MNKKYQNLKHDFVKRIKGVSALRHLYSRVATFHPNNMETDMFIGQHMYNVTRSLAVLAYYWATTRDTNSVGRGLHTNFAGFKVGSVRERGYSSGNKD